MRIYEHYKFCSALAEASDQRGTLNLLSNPHYHHHPPKTFKRALGITGG